MSLIANLGINLDTRDAAAKLRQFVQGTQAAGRAAQQLQTGVTATGRAMDGAGRQLQSASGKLRDYAGSATKAQRGNQGLGSSAGAAASGIERQGRAAAVASSGVSKLSGAIRRLLAAYSLIGAAKFVFAKTAELETQTRSIQVLVGSLEKAEQIVSELQQYANVTPFTSAEIIDTAKRLSAFGISATDVVETTKRLGDVAGATGANLGELALAYGQVVSKGRLQTEELLQFQERGVSVQAELQKMYKLSGEELQDAISKGEVSAEAFEVAIKNLTSAGGKYANGAISQSDTLSGKLSTLQDGVEGIARSIGLALSPAIKAVLNEAIFAVNQINELLGTAARAQKFGLDQSARKSILDQASKEAEQIVETRRIRDPFKRNAEFIRIRQERERDLIESYGYQTGQIKAPSVAATPVTTVPQLTGGTRSGAGRTGKGSRAAAAKGPEDTSAQLQEQVKRFREQADIQNRIRDLQFQGRERLAAESQLEAEILQINYDRNDALKAANFEGERRNINALAESKIIDAQAKAADQIREINNRRFQEELQNQQAVRDAAKTISSVREQQETQLKNAEEYRRLLQNGLLPAEAQRILNFQNLVKEELKALDAQIDIAKAAYLEAESRGAARSELAKEIELLERKRKAVEDAAAAGPGRGETDLDRINAGATAAQERLNELTNLGNIVVTSANNIGNAFGEAFNKLVTGAASAKQVLSDFFQSVAQGFFKMAQEIIAQTLIMITLQAILKALGGASTSGGDSGSTTNMADVGRYADSTSSIGLGDFPIEESAKGNAFTPQGPVERYAKGGIVNVPTLFRYAKGGTFAPGLMGEAGPEAILPLRRTPDGRLGVTQVRSPQDADRMREMMGRSPAQQQAPMLNLKFETTTINGVEYVSREQLEVAMAETRKRASKEGAERGMSMTLDKMRNSPRTRAQVGMR